MRYLTQEQVEDWIIDDLAPRFANNHGKTMSEYRKAFKEKFGANYVAALEAEAGKHGFDGTPLCVWHDYVAGTDPLDETSLFTAMVDMVDGLPVITWSPDLNENGTKNIRRYITSGKTSLTDKTWMVMDDVPIAERSRYHFFRVSVEMP